MLKTLHLYLIAFLVFASVLTTFAQTAPLLGTTANFVLFTRNGAVTNNGFSHLTGNVGSNVGSSTGFGNVNGQMHDQDGASNTASAELLFVYDQLNDAIPTKFPASNLGNGDTLTAGTYSIASTATLGGALYLKGDANSVFIFQIGGAFSSASLSHVELLGGALACNVFWKVEGLVDLASNTVMRGTIVAHNAAIVMGVGDTLEGRALSTTGAVSVDGITAYTPIGCGSPVLTGPAAPNLGTAACYGLLSGNGAMLNSGISFITGDVGTNVGLTTGFDAQKVTGTIHPIPDVSTAAASAALLNAYNYTNILPYDIELLYPAQFGHNLVLTPHTYLMNAATSFTDTVFLNALGNQNAVFVIKINGALSTSDFAIVKLINGAQAKNVYWKIDGAVTLNTSTHMVGTVIINGGSNILATGVSIDGRMLTTTGAVSTNAITTTMDAGACATVPVSWIYFQGKNVRGQVVLDWATSNEVGNGLFTLEKSLTGNNFEVLTTVKATASIINGEKRYSFTDMQPNTSNYYRISQTDLNGQRNYYKTIQVNAAKAINVVHYTRGNSIYVQVDNTNAGKGSLTLYATDGRKFNSNEVTFENGSNAFKIPKPVQKGLYLLYITNNGQRIYGTKLIVE